jgi:hypothetical protein
VGIEPGLLVPSSVFDVWQGDAGQTDVPFGKPRVQVFDFSAHCCNFWLDLLGGQDSVCLIPYGI